MERTYRADTKRSTTYQKLAFYYTTLKLWTKSLRNSLCFISISEIVIEPGSDLQRPLKLGVAAPKKFSNRLKRLKKTIVGFGYARHIILKQTRVVGLRCDWAAAANRRLEKACVPDGTNVFAAAQLPKFRSEDSLLCILLSTRVLSVVFGGSGAEKVGMAFQQKARNLVQRFEQQVSFECRGKWFSEILIILARTSNKQ